MRDACVVAALWGGTEEIVKFWYGKLETSPEIAGMGIYLLKTSGPGFFDADFCQRMRCGVERGSRLLNRGAVWKGKSRGGCSVCRSSPTIVCSRGQKER